MKATANLPKRTRYPVSVRPRFRTLSAPRAIKRLEIKKILVPIDFSASSHQAIKFSLPFLEEFGAELHLVHVAESQNPLAGLAAMPIIISETELLANTHLNLKRAGKRCGVELQPANLHTLRGTPFEEICRVAREIDIDLIVIPTRGHTGFKHLLLGSTAERVVRYAPCPVFVFKPQRHERGNGNFSDGKIHFAKILVPMDFSDCSKKGLNYAKALALQLGSKLVLFNSVSLSYHISNDEYARYDFPQLVASSEKASRKEMEKMVKRARLERAEIETSVVIGHAGQEICARADKSDIDLIVTSTHGRTGFKHVLVGSTAEYVVRHAACPVLVVPAHDRPLIKSNGVEL